MREAIIKELEQLVSGEQILLNEPMAAHTTFRIGGPADVFVRPASAEQLQAVMALLRKEEQPFFLLGNGSNLLVHDSGYRGVVIQVGPAMSEVSVEGNLLTAQAGASMYKAAQAAMEHGLTGLEFASGIPGTIGGGVIMNAGAYDGEFAFVVKTVTALTPEGKLETFTKEQMEFGYRHSMMKAGGYAVTEVVFELQPGDKEQIKEKMADFAARRRDKQPLEYPSAGSTFKRPEGLFAGKLIQDAGLRGYTYGGAAVSEKHCGFVINKGNATSEDVMKVIQHTQECVKEQFGVMLEPEVLFLGNGEKA